MAVINKSKTRAGQDVGEGEPFCTVGGKADWCSHCGKQYGVTSKVKNGSANDPMIPLVGIYPKKPETLNLKEYKHPYVHCSIIYNCQGLEAAGVSISR